MIAFLLLGLAAFFGLFLLYPLCLMLGGTFFVEHSVGVNAAGKAITAHVFSLEYYRLVFENPFLQQCMINSLIIAIGTTLGCLILALPLAQLFLKYRFPGKAALGSLILVPLILPPFVGALGLKQLFSRFGSVNLLLEQLGIVNLHHPPDWFGSGGFFGIIVMLILHLYPIMFLSVQAAMANVDPSLKDAARNLGASGWRIFRTVTLPLSMPGIFAGTALVFVSAFTDLGVPLMFEFQTTIPSQIFYFVSQPGSPTGLVLVVLMLLLVGVVFALTRLFGQGDYAMMGRSATTTVEEPLRGFTAILVPVLIGGLILLSAIPHLGVILQSFSGKWFMTVLPEQWTTGAYRDILDFPLTVSSIRNSLLYSSASCVLDIVLGLTIAWLLSRANFFGKSLLDSISMLPLALPGLVLAFAYLSAFSIGPFLSIKWLTPRSDPTLLLVIAYTVHRLPYMVRAACAGFQQTAVTLEEASINLGASRLMTFRKITSPLIAANLAAGIILAFSFAMLDVSNGMILAQEEPRYPMTKAIFALMGRITPNAPSIACAMGVLAMILLGISLYASSRMMGKSMGRLFKV